MLRSDEYSDLMFIAPLFKCPPLPFLQALLQEEHSHSRQVLSTTAKEVEVEKPPEAGLLQRERESTLSKICCSSLIVSHLPLKISSYLLPVLLFPGSSQFNKLHSS